MQVVVVADLADLLRQGSQRADRKPELDEFAGPSQPAALDFGVRHQALVPERLVLLPQLGSTQVAHQQPPMGGVDGHDIGERLRQVRGQRTRRDRLHRGRPHRRRDNHARTLNRGSLGLNSPRGYARARQDTRGQDTENR